MLAPVVQREVFFQEFALPKLEGHSFRAVNQDDIVVCQAGLAHLPEVFLIAESGNGGFVNGFIKHPAQGPDAVFVMADVVVGDGQDADIVSYCQLDIVVYCPFAVADRGLQMQGPGDVIKAIGCGGDFRLGIAFWFGLAVY